MNIKNLVSEMMLDGAVALTTIPGHTDALLTVRGKDHDLTPENLRRLAAMCIVSANLLDGGAGDADSGLEVNATGGLLNVQIGTRTLSRTISGVSPDMDDSDYFIRDPSVFAESMACALREEEEDGTTLVHGVLDQAVQHCLEQGLEGILFIDEIEDEDGDCPNCQGELYEVADCDDKGNQIGSSMQCDSCLYSKEI